MLQASEWRAQRPTSAATPRPPAVCLPRRQRAHGFHRYQPPLQWGFYPGLIPQGAHRHLLVCSQETPEPLCSLLTGTSQKAWHHCSRGRGPRQVTSCRLFFGWAGLRHSDRPHKESAQVRCWGPRLTSGTPAGQWESWVLPEALSCTPDLAAPAQTPSMTTRGTDATAQQSLHL